MEQINKEQISKIEEVIFALETRKKSLSLDLILIPIMAKVSGEELKDKDKERFYKLKFIIQDLQKMFGDCHKTLTDVLDTFE